MHCSVSAAEKTVVIGVFFSLRSQSIVVLDLHLVQCGSDSKINKKSSVIALSHIEYKFHKSKTAF